MVQALLDHVIPLSFPVDAADFLSGGWASARAPVRRPCTPNQLSRQILSEHIMKFYCAISGTGSLMRLSSRALIICSFVLPFNMCLPLGSGMGIGVKPIFTTLSRSQYDILSRQFRVLTGMVACTHLPVVSFQEVH